MHQTPDRTRRARSLRAAMTRTEVAFWEMVRNRRFGGLKFRRQTSVAGFTVDFFCPELALIVELDGGVHRLREEEDAARDARLLKAGFTVLRFSNSLFETNPGKIFEAIRSHAASR